MFTWPNILLVIMAGLLGVGVSLSLGRLFEKKISKRQAENELEETFRREELQNELDDQAEDT